jgi:hypothetical protein
MIPGDIRLPGSLLAELTATCDALGYNDGNKIHLDKNSIGELIFNHFQLLVNL